MESLQKNKSKLKKESKKNQRKGLIFVCSLFVGLINGFFGGGGGMVCVPLLEEVLGVDNKKAHATSLIVILFLSIVSGVVYFLKGSVNLSGVIFVGVGVLIGGILGALLLIKLNGKVVRLIFALIMLAAGVRMLI